MFFKNMAGSNSLRIGDGENSAVLTDDGNVEGNQGTFQYVYCFGNVDCNDVNSRGAIICNNNITAHGDMYCNHIYADNTTSIVEKKKDIKKFNKSALDIVNNTDIYEYRLKKDKATDKKRIGFVIGEGYNYTHEITDTDEEGKEIGVNNYSMNSVSFKAIQELHQIVQEQQKTIEEQNKRIEILENKIKGGN